MTDLEAAITEVKKVTEAEGPWDATDFVRSDLLAAGKQPGPLDHAEATILNAVASGDLITREASDARAGALLREAAGVVENPGPVVVSDYGVEYHESPTQSELVERILAISPDATAALDRAVKAARDDAMKKAERAVWLALKHSSSITSDLATSAIRALAQEVGQ